MATVKTAASSARDEALRKRLAARIGTTKPAKAAVTPKPVAQPAPQPPVDNRGMTAGKIGEGLSVTLANRKTPWETGLTWEQGQKPGDYTTLTSAKEMLEIAGMDGWDVQKQALYLADGRLLPRQYATVAKDGRILGRVGESFRVFQNEDVFAFGDNIVDSGEAKWERAGGFQNGAVTFGCMELTHLGIIVPGDNGGELKPYLLLVNAFDGSRPAQGVIAFVRPVCMNTFEMAVSTVTKHRFAIRHTGAIEGKVLMAREALGIAFKHAAEVKPLVDKLAMAKIVDKQVKSIFDKVWPSPKDTPAEKRDELASSLAFANYLTSPTIDGIRGTAWGALNAVTEFLDHETVYKSLGVNTPADVRFNSLIWGVSEQRKETALRELIKLAK